LSLHKVIAGAMLGLGFIAAAPAADLPTAAPESQGFSPERLARIATVLNYEIEKGQYPGVVVLVARKGQVVYHEAFGQIADGVPMTRDALFRIYSMTKPFTSVAAMMLVEEGRLRLTDPVSKYLPALAKREVSLQVVDPVTGKIDHQLVPAEREMTIQDLLRHTSGLVYTGFTFHSEVKEAYTREKVGWQDMTPAEQIERLAKVPLAHQPGTVFEYGLSTDVLGRVVETITGMPLSKFLGERIFTPLAMRDTSFLVPAADVRRLAQPAATDPLSGNPIKLLDVTVPQKNDAGGAGAVSTAADYARFLQMMLNHGELEGTRLLSRTTVDYMASDHLGDIKSSGFVALPPPIGFGLGFAVRKAPGIADVIGSEGEYYWAGAAGTGFWIDPKEQMVLVFMTQAMPGLARRYDRYLFKQLVYQALTD
jgi:CubicO group peptidase (beta-lactamase class C family)